MSVHPTEHPVEYEPTKKDNHQQWRGVDSVGRLQNGSREHLTPDPTRPSAWLRPRSARFRFTWQNHCNSATSCRFSTSGLPVTAPEPRPARAES